MDWFELSESLTDGSTQINYLMAKQWNWFAFSGSCLALPSDMCCHSQLWLPQHTTIEWLVKEKKLIFSQFWRLRVQTQGAGRTDFLRGFSSWLAGDCSLALSSHGCPFVLKRCLCVSKFLLRAHSNDPHFNWMTVLKALSLDTVTTVWGTGVRPLNYEHSLAGNTRDTLSQYWYFESLVIKAGLPRGRYW